MALQMEALKAIADQLQAIVSALNSTVRVSDEGCIHNALETILSDALRMNESAELVETLKPIAKR